MFRKAAIGSAVAALVLAAGTSGASTESRVLSAHLSGANEVPGPADPDGSGAAQIRFVSGEQNVCYDIQVRDIAPATMAHIHGGARGEAGTPPVLALGAPTDGASSGCVSAPQEVVDRIRADPGAFFVNIHNQEFPGGAVRGQLHM